MRIFAVLALVGSALIGPAFVQPAAAAVTCPANPAPGSTVGTITVSGGTCTLDNITVTGSIIVLGGGRLTTKNGTSVGGGITGQPNSVLCLLPGTRVGGAVSQTGGVGANCDGFQDAFVIIGATVGSATVNGATDFVFICDATIKGNMTVINGIGSFKLAAANYSARCAAGRNTIGGRVTVTDNVSTSQIIAEKNDVSGAMEFSRNTSPFNGVGSNVVKGSLACADNNAAPNLAGGVANSAGGGKSGQCALL